MMRTFFIGNGKSKIRIDQDGPTKIVEEIKALDKLFDTRKNFKD